MSWLSKISRLGTLVCRDPTFHDVNLVCVNGAIVRGGVGKEVSVHVGVGVCFCGKPGGGR